MRILRILGIAAGALCLLAIGLWLGRLPIANAVAGRYLAGVRRTYEGADPSARIHAYLPTIEADRAELAKYPVFAPSAGRSDAAPFLNPMLRWDGEVPPAWKEPKALSLSPELKATLEQKDWLAWRIDWAAWKLDFGWLAAAAQFDVWSIDEQCPAIDAHKAYQWGQFPDPDLSDLARWAKLRLLKAKLDGDVDQALDQVVHLARLVWTNDNLLSAMVTMQLLDIASTFAAAQSPPIARPDLPPKATLDRGRRYVWALTLGLDPRLDAADWDRLAGQPGLCAAVDQELPTYGMVRQFLFDELAEPARRFGALVSRTAGACRPSWQRRAFAEPDYPWVFKASDDVFEEARMLGGSGESVVRHGPSVRWAELRTYPALRIVVGYLLTDIAAPDPLRRYESDAAPER